MASKNYVHKIAAFREIMLQRLRANRSKGGWRDESFPYLYGRLMEESAEIVMAVRYGKNDKAQIARECADVANFAMMIADVAGALK